ncbi:uncharacterized protein BJX67DRAFT_159034 [Aspergillus lucknowensis]|uniref:Uncharacterized protein n=1 Tax=Aspergillus lucknowensis TaxID=176173 RepID=A0ABR4M408_9EURO
MLEEQVIDMADVVDFSPNGRFLPSESTINFSFCLGKCSRLLTTSDEDLGPISRRERTGRRSPWPRMKARPEGAHSPLPAAAPGHNEIALTRHGRSVAVSPSGRSSRSKRRRSEKLHSNHEICPDALLYFSGALRGVRDSESPRAWTALTTLGRHEIISDEPWQKGCH